MMPDDLDPDRPPTRPSRMRWKAPASRATRCRGVVCHRCRPQAGRVRHRRHHRNERRREGCRLHVPDGKTVVDVGAEEGRGVKTDAEGKVVDFAGNEKCAAGAGAFAESMSRALQMTPQGVRRGQPAVRQDAFR